MLSLGHLPARSAVVELRLEHDDRIRVPDCRGQEPLGVGRRGRYRDLHARRVHVVGLGRVVVQLGRAHAAAVRHAHDERELHGSARPPAVAAHVVDQLIERRVREGVVLHLADRAKPGHAQPDGGAHDPSLRQRSVHAALGAEALAQAGGGAEHASRPADVLAHDEHGLVTLHLDVERVVHRLHDGQLRHRAPFAARRGRPRRRAAASSTRARRRARDRPAALPRPLRCPVPSPRSPPRAPRRRARP